MTGLSRSWSRKLSICLKLTVTFTLVTQNVTRVKEILVNDCRSSKKISGDIQITNVKVLTFLFPRLCHSGHSHLTFQIFQDVNTWRDERKLTRFLEIPWNDYLRWATWRILHDYFSSLKENRGELFTIDLPESFDFMTYHCHSHSKV